MYSSRVDEDGKLIRNVANYGANIGGKAMLERNGEYYKFTVEFLERVKPLLTNLRIIKAIEAIHNNDLILAIKF